MADYAVLFSNVNLVWSIIRYGRIRCLRDEPLITDKHTDDVKS